MDDHFYDDEDLVTTSQPDRNWRGIIIAVLVIASVCALIVTSVVLLTPPDDGPRVKGRRFELDDIFGPEFQPYRLNGTWISDLEWIYRDPSGGVSILDVINLTTQSIISNHTFRRFNAVSFHLSADLKYILFTHDVQKVHRHSYLAKYTLFEIKTGETKAMSIEPPSTSKITSTRDRNVNQAKRHGPETHSTLQLIKWAPSGGSLAVVFGNDIYFKPNPKAAATYRLTDTGVQDTIYNGVPDWLYEEEIFSTNTAMWFSADGQKLLYLTFNDTLVGEHHLLYYGTTETPHIYPELQTQRYPKPGTKNPVVTAKICDLREGFKTVRMQPPEGLSTEDHYITSVGWIRSSEVGIVWTSRSYNLSIITVCSVSNGSCDEVYRITTERRGWVENIPFPVFSTKFFRSFITIAPIRDGENGFFDHLVLVDTMNKRSHPITHGSYDVVKINAWDEENKLIYFTVIPSQSPGERRFLRMRVEQPYTEHSPDCLSCPQNRTVGSENDVVESFNHTVSPITPQTGKTGKKGKGKGESAEDGIVSHRKGGNPTSTWTSRSGGSGSLLSPNKSCSFVTNVRFNPNKSYFILECSGPDIPEVTLYTTTDTVTAAASVDKISPAFTSFPQQPSSPFKPTASPSNVRLVQVLQDNAALVKLSSSMAYPQIRTFAVHMLAGHTVQVRLFLPPGLREDEITKYPLVLNVYGGPGTQLNIDRWGIDFVTYLASKKDYIVAQIDGRGSCGRGWDFQHQVFYKLGQLEVDDQIEVVRYLRDSLHFVEKKKIGVWGWSYGGYLTAMIMNTRETTDLFQCGASIAPVTSWRLYDSAYTERYMGMPNVTDNYKGYAESDITRNVEHFAGKMFYLIHGTADDNVHITHSMLLAKALVEKKILFRQQVYPDESHGLSGVKMHVHRSLETFFEDCFRKQIPPEIGTGLNKGGKFDDFD